MRVHAEDSDMKKLQKVNSNLLKLLFFEYI